MLLNRALLCPSRIHHSSAILKAAMVQTRRQSARAAQPTAAAEQQQQQSPAPIQDEFEGVKNCRDLAEAHSKMRPGMVFRTAAPLEATQHDIKLLYNDLGIKDLIDLRSSEELREDGDAVAFAGASYCQYRRDPAVERVVPDASTYSHGDSGIVRVQIPIMEKNRYYYSLLSRMSKRKVVQLVLLSVVDKPRSRRLAIEEVNQGGLEGLYRVFIEDSAPWFVAALRHISKSAESGRPVLFFCKAGKDRTGLLAALLLSVLGASEEAILSDYVRSDAYHMVGLAGLENNPKVTGLNRDVFERAPREAMHFALQLLQDRYGGAQQYLVKAGLGLDEQQQLRQLLLRPECQGTAAAAAADGAAGQL